MYPEYMMMYQQRTELRCAFAESSSQLLRAFKLLNNRILSTTKTDKTAGCQWLTPVILAIRKAEISRISVQGQPRQIVLNLKKTHHKKKGGLV
jgi:hypothetical protein